MMLSESAKKVQEMLAHKGLSFKVIELSSSTRTASDAANTLHCEVGQIVKSLLFCTEKTNQPILILASGSNRVDEKLVAKMMGEAIHKADATFTREITGFAIGGVPPIGHKEQIKTILIDKDLLSFQTLWAAAGTPNAVFSFPASELENLTGGKFCSIK